VNAAPVLIDGLEVRGGPMLPSMPGPVRLRLGLAAGLLLASAACAGLDLSGVRPGAPGVAPDRYGAFGATPEAAVVRPGARPRPHLSAEAFAELRDRLRRDDGFRADRTRACAREL
jgi:hypothetical protein